MVKVENNTITVTRGDTLEVPVYISTAEGEQYIPAPGDIIRFALKGSFKDADPLIVKRIPNSSMMLRLEASETKQLPASKKGYVFDIELTTPAGNVDTFLCGEMYVTEEVC